MHQGFQRLPFLLAFPFLLPISGVLAADAPKRVYSGVPRVTSIYPCGGARGSTVEVTITGTRLHNPTQLLVKTTDKIRLVKAAPGPVDPKRPADVGTTAVATLEIAADCPTGVHHVRIVTDYGIGEVIPFSVGAFPIQQETENNSKTDTNGTRETAEPTESGKTLQGQLNGPDIEFFSFKAEKGELISAELECARLATETEDGTEVRLSLLDASGAVLAACEDTSLFLTDPFVSLKAPASGTYFVALHPVLPPVNSRKIPWQLHLGKFARPAAVFPAGGPPGAALQIKLLGMPGEPAAQAEVTLPAITAGFHPYHATAQTPGPNLLRVSPGPNILETEPNDTPDRVPTTAGSGELAFNGVLEKDGDVDVFRFTAKKDETMLIATYCQAIGSPADLQMEIAPADAKTGARGEKKDDSTDAELDFFEQYYTRERLDPRVLFTAKSDGDYFLTIKDSRSKGGPQHIYRAEITKPKPGLLLGLSAPDNNARNVRSSVVVGKGRRSIAWLNCRAAYGTEKIAGEFELEAIDLPPGLTISAPRFEATTRRIPVTFTAAPDAAVTGAFVRFRAKPVAADQPAPEVRFRHLVGLTYANNDLSTAAEYEALAVAVTDVVPFELIAEAPKAPLSKNGELLIDVMLNRDTEYKGEVEIFLENPPQGLQAQTGCIMGPNLTKSTFRISAESAAAATTHRLTLTARNRGEDGRWGRMYSASEPFTLEVGEPYFRVKLPRTSIERGKSEEVTATIERVRKLDQDATLSLIRLPKGVTLESPAQLPKDATEAKLKITVSADALIGTYNSVAVEATIKLDGKDLKQVVGSATLRIDPARTVTGR